MTTDLKAIRASAEAAIGLPEGSWNYEPNGQTVWNGGTHMVCDISGWDHLQYMPNGAELQDAMGQHIANLNPATVIALLDRLEAAEKDASRYQWLRTASLDTWLRAEHYTDVALDAFVDTAMKELE